jgi:hypothetical protein
MARILLLDGVKYESWFPEKEDEFEEVVKEHSKEIFGNDCLYIDVKRRIKSESGISSIPDGYLIDFSDNSLWIVEVELSKHSHKHMVVQLDAFLKGIKNPETQKVIVEAIYSVIKDDILLDAFVRKRLSPKDPHHFLSELISKGLSVVVVVDELTEKVEQAFENFKVQPYFVELKTFVRANVGIGAHAHLIKVPERWEELSRWDAIYDVNKQVFRCNYGEEAHKNSFAYKVGGEIVEHLLLVHGITPDKQHIDGWTDDFQKEARDYFAKKYFTKST